ncbi:MAG TPA: AAA family ATPase [Methylocystis sp.]
MPERDEQTKIAALAVEIGRTLVQDEDGKLHDPETGEIIEPASGREAANRDNLTVAAWLRLELPPRDYLLGELLCTTSRWLLIGETGIGKTLFCLDMAGAIAAGRSFLDWNGWRRSRVMYLDGELPAETFKERIEIIAARYGCDLELFGYSRDVLGPNDMPPLNVPAGQQWLWREINIVKPDIIFFDSIMCLMNGDMKDDMSWEPVKQLIRKISSRRIAQVWMHHTGHDNSKGFGTKTREWEMDTVAMLTRASDDTDSNSVLLQFNKARLRTPKTADQFAAKTLACGEDGWISHAADTLVKVSKDTRDALILKSEIAKSYDRLASDVETTRGLNGALVQKVSIDDIRDDLARRGFLERSEPHGGITATHRTRFYRAKVSLINSQMFVEEDGLFWRISFLK